MNWIENVLIIAGVSLDIFAAMECQGALVAKVDKKQLSVICALIAVWQLCALALGNYLSGLLYRNELAHDENFVGLVIAKAIKNEWVNERREETLDVKKFLRMTAVTSIYTLLAGIAFGFLGTNVALMLIIIVCMTIAFVVLGVYTGYHLGFQHKTKAYVGGALLLWIAGIDVIVRHIMC